MTDKSSSIKEEKMVPSAISISREEQRRQVSEAVKSHGPPASGENWFAYSLEFWRSFTEAKEEIELIDNSAIFDSKLKGLKQGLEEGKHYILQPASAHELLTKYFKINLPLELPAVEAGDGSVVIDILPAKFIIQKVISNTQKHNDELTKGEEKDCKENIELFSVSRYMKFGKLKGSIAKHLKVKPQQISVRLRSSGPNEKFQSLADADAEDMEKTISDVLPEVGSLLWELEVQVQPADDRNFSLIHKYNVKDPQVGQRVDAKYDKKWYEAVIIEVTPLPLETPKKTSASAEKNEKESAKFTGDGVRKMKIHFLSFDSSKDRTLQVGSDEVCQAYSKVADWRIQLRTNSKVEIQKSVLGIANSNSKEWIEGVVTQIDRAATTDLKTKYFKQISSRRSQDSEKNSSMLKKFKNYMPIPWSSSSRNLRSQVTSPLSPNTNRSVASTDSDVVSISHHGLVAVKIATSATYFNKSYKFCVVDLGSEEIAAENTHIPKKRTGGLNFYKDTHHKPAVHGVVGLKNIGNTCYMNSTLQCLLASPWLKDYFLSGEYKSDVNRKNPLGYGGRVAIAYGKLIETYFSDQYSTIAPSDFKSAIGNANSIFQGYAQQDSHELLNVLIDALHEDLNKVKNKPIVETPESDGKSDEELATIEWDNFLKRNRSAIVDVLYGQMKSHLTCPKCKREAVKFDTFSSWTVPIPFKDVRLFRVTLFTLHPKFVQVVRENNKIRHKIVEKLANMDDEVYETRAFRFYLQSEQGAVYGQKVARTLSKAMNISMDDIAVYILKANSAETPIYDKFSHPNKYYPYNSYADPEFVAYEFQPLETDKDSRSSLGKVKHAEVATEKKQSSTKTLPKASVVGEGNSSGKIEKDDARDPSKTLPRANVVKDDAKSIKNVEKEGNVKEKHSIESSEEEEEEEEEPLYLLLKFRKKGSYINRAVRISEVLRFYGSKTTVAKLHEMIWMRTKSLFDVDDKLKENGYGAMDHDVTEAEMELSRKFYKVEYEGKKIDPKSTELFKMGVSHAADTIYVDMDEGAKFFQKNVKPEAPSSYLSKDLDSYNKSLNVGFVCNDASCFQQNPRDEPVDIYKCFEAFRMKEKLEKSEAWYCSKCKEHVQADKKMDIYKTGQVLIIVLKRFREFGGRREKLDCPVDFPVRGLDMNKLIQSNEQTQKTFDLYGVSYHSGSLLGGHYTASIKVEDKWYHMNDQIVRATSEETLVVPNAYVLFYRQNEVAKETPVEQNTSI